MHEYAKRMFTDAVVDAQTDYGSADRLARFTEIAGPNDLLTEREAEFIAERDSFYMATVNESGWPYVQHRGGPKGFLRVLGPNELAFADYRGNMQLITAGNTRVNDRVSIILVDYPNQRRLKLIGHIRFMVAESFPDELLDVVRNPDYRAVIERVAFIKSTAFDWNCPQHITPRFTEAEWLAGAGIAR